MIYSAAVNPKTKRAINGLEPRQRAGMDRPGMDRIGSRDRARPVPIPRLRRPEVGLFRNSTGSPTSCSRKKRTTTRINALDPNLKPFISRGGKLISVSRLERSADRACGRRPSTTIAWWRCLAAGTTCTTPIGCSWRPAWDTAAAEKGRTRLTCSPRSSGGSRRASRRIRLRRLSRGRRRCWIGRGRCVLTRRWLCIKGPEAQTTRQTLPVELSESLPHRRSRRLWCRNAESPACAPSRWQVR